MTSATTSNNWSIIRSPTARMIWVHQLIRGLNPKFSVLKTLLPLLPKFPTFIEARELIRSEQTSQ
jgi:hypothetical protein